ncbi:MAG: DUF370 domain-containing protein [Oscillospiraceae bacterium]|nr:DUF370 domain-containing protein [Oscillospiraceae bacterium]
MYVHLGSGKMIAKNSIIGIFDLDNCSRAKATRNFLARSEKEGRVAQVGEDIPRSFTIVSEGGNCSIYLSQISSSTLSKRAESDIFSWR